MATAEKQYKFSTMTAEKFDEQEYEVDKETLESYKGRFDSREVWQVIFTDC